MFACNICIKQFCVQNSQQLELFVTHVSKCRLQVTSVLKPRFHCSVCDKSVKYKRSLRDHIEQLHLSDDVSAQKLVATESDFSPRASSSKATVVHQRNVQRHQGTEFLSLCIPYRNYCQTLKIVCLVFSIKNQKNSISILHKLYYIFVHSCR